MEHILEVIIQQYGILGLLLLALVTIGYLIWGDRKNNWGSKITDLCGKMDNVGHKVDMIEDKLSARIDAVENKISNLRQENKIFDKNEAREQTTSIMANSLSGKISKILRSYCSKINCDHVFLGSFHNGTTDLRGLHYCKFDILIDEFKDPLHLHPQDTDFQPLYRDVNLMAYGDLPYQLAHTDVAVIQVNDEDNTLLELSDTLYRRCTSRDIKSIGFAMIRDVDGYPTGFLGCVCYDDSNMLTHEILSCAKTIENIYNDNHE